MKKNYKNYEINNIKTLGQFQANGSYPTKSFLRNFTTIYGKYAQQ